MSWRDTPRRLATGLEHDSKRLDSQFSVMNEKLLGSTTIVNKVFTIFMSSSFYLSLFPFHIFRPGEMISEVRGPGLRGPSSKRALCIQKGPLRPFREFRGPFRRSKCPLRSSKGTFSTQRASRVLRWSAYTPFVLVTQSTSVKRALFSVYRVPQVPPEVDIYGARGDRSPRPPRFLQPCTYSRNTRLLLLLTE